MLGGVLASRQVRLFLVDSGGALTGPSGLVAGSGGERNGQLVARVCIETRSSSRVRSVVVNRQSKGVAVAL